MLEKIIGDSPATILFILGISIIVQLAVFSYFYSRVGTLETKVNSLLSVVQSHVGSKQRDAQQDARRRAVWRVPGIAR